MLGFIAVDDPISVFADVYGGSNSVLTILSVGTIFAVGTVLTAYHSDKFIESSLESKLLCLFICC